MTQIHKNIVIITLVALLFFPFISPIIAQETTIETALARETAETIVAETDVDEPVIDTEETDIDEPVIDVVEPSIEEITNAIENEEYTGQTISDEITSQNLDIKEAKILPDHPFYFLKNWGRATKLFFTTNPLKRATLRLHYSNEKLMEIKELSKNKELKDNKKAPKIKKIINRSLDKWEKEQQKIKIDQLITNHEVGSDESKKDKFIQKYIDHNLKQEFVLQKLEDQLPPDIFNNVRDKREIHLEKFSQVMEKVQEKHQTAKEYFERAIDNIPSNLSDQQLRVLEIINNVEERTDQNNSFIKEIKQQKTQEIKTHLINIPSIERKEKIEQFFSQAIINPIEKLEIIKEIKVMAPTIKRELTISRENIIVDFGKKIEAMSSIKTRERFLEGIVEHRERHIETLGEIQTKLENNLPKGSQSPQIIKEIIEQREKRIENREKEKMIIMNKEGIDESVERPLPAKLDPRKIEPNIGERALRIKTQLRTIITEQGMTELLLTPGTMIIEETKPIIPKIIIIEPEQTNVMPIEASKPTTESAKIESGKDDATEPAKIESNEITSKIESDKEY